MLLYIQIRTWNVKRISILQLFTTLIFMQDAKIGIIIFSVEFGLYYKKAKKVLLSQSKFISSKYFFPKFVVKYLQTFFLLENLCVSLFAERQTVARVLPRDRVVEPRCAMSLQFIFVLTMMQWFMKNKSFNYIKEWL